MPSYQLLPPLTDEEFAALRADIADRGVLVPVEYDDDGNVLDGHHRLRAVAELRAEGVEVPEPPTIVRAGMSEEAKRDHVLTVNLARRVLTRDQKQALAVQLRSDGWVLERIARCLAVSYGTVHSWCGGVNISSDNETPAIVNARGQARPTTYRPRQPEAAEAVLPKNDEDPLEPEVCYGEEDFVDPDAAEPVPVSDREGYDGDEWYTPREYVEAVREVLGEIDLDPASCEAAQAEVGAGAWYGKEQDGLAQPWHGRVFLNPPYSFPLVAKFTQRALDAYAAGEIDSVIVLTNNCTDSAWCQRMLESCPACFTSGRVAFWYPEREAFQTRQGQIFFYLGPDADEFARIFSGFGTVVHAMGGG